MFKGGRCPFNRAASTFTSAGKGKENNMKNWSAMYDLILKLARGQGGPTIFIELQGTQLIIRFLFFPSLQDYNFGLTIIISNIGAITRKT